VTSGLNSVINSVPLAPGDEVLCLSVTYGSTKKILKDACSRSGATMKIAQVPLPIESDESVLRAVSSQLTARTRLVVLDQITSNTALVLPIARLSALCRESGAIVLVDAAHSMFATDCAIYKKTYNKGTESGNQSVDSHKCSSSRADPAVAVHAEPEGPAISSFADVWITNAHKWMCAPKGAAFMWISPRMAGKLRPSVVSHGYAPNDSETDHQAVGRYAARDKLLSSYAWDGCRDYAALLTMPTIIDFWTQLGRKLSNGGSQSGHTNYLDVFRQHNRDLVQRAAELLSHEWRVTEGDFAAPYSMRRDSPMCLVGATYSLLHPS
jgi:isopenicillin-N epimerase